MAGQAESGYPVGRYVTLFISSTALLIAGGVAWALGADHFATA